MASTNITEAMCGMGFIWNAFWVELEEELERP
jgi:hypothetical protein